VPERRLRARIRSSAAAGSRLRHRGGERLGVHCDIGAGQDALDRGFDFIGQGVGVRERLGAFDEHVASTKSCEPE